MAQVWCGRSLSSQQHNSTGGGGGGEMGEGPFTAWARAGNVIVASR